MEQKRRSTQSLAQSPPTTLTLEVQREWKSTRFQRANQRGKGQKGKSPPKGKGKDKGKSKDAKGKGKSQQSGKGYGSPSKGVGKTQAKPTDVNRCNYCGAFGHWTKDCRKFQADKASGAVRQVEGDNHSQRVASSPSSTGTAQQSPSADFLQVHNRQCQSCCFQ